MFPGKKRCLLSSFKHSKFKASHVAALLCLGAQAPSLWAADETPPRLSRVEVTGSRILAMTADSAAPLQVLSAADIAASGAVNLQELLLKSPLMGTPLISRNNSNITTSSVGIATLDLRNLGVDRSLVLVNGRRHVAGMAGSSAVDLNTIPADFIERVELLTGGASAAYGSGAVAGVINIILKREFEGLLLDAQVGQSQHGDDAKRKFGATLGHKFAQGNLMLHGAVTRQGAVYSRDRAATAKDQYSLVLDPGSKDPADLFRPGPWPSSYAPQGQFFGVDAAGQAQDFTFDAQGRQIPWSLNGPNNDGVGATSFNRADYRAIAVPVDRYLLAAKGDLALNAAHVLFFEGTWARSQAQSHIEPFALSSSDIYPTTGWVPTVFEHEGQVLRNPLVPENLQGDYAFTRRLSDIGARHVLAKRDSLRLLLGLRGELSPAWSYEAYAVHGQTREAQSSSGLIDVRKFRHALEAVPNANGRVTCRDAEARAQGCVPLSLFGFNSISPAAAAYVSAPGQMDTKLTQQFAGFNLNGEPWQLPAGPLALALGGEVRRESSDMAFDAVSQAGLNASNALPNTQGSFEVKELFVEARLPLLKSLPALQRLDAMLAYRLSDYSTAGLNHSWNLGLDWAINPSLRARFSRAQSSRAPNIGELYQARMQNYPTVQDPCEGVRASDTTVLAQRCKAAPGVQANMAAHGGVFTLTPLDLQSVSGYDSGNPLLQAEVGRSSTLGLVLTPKGLPGLSQAVFSVDFFDIQIARAINNPGRQYALDQCYNGGAQSFCRFISRRAEASVAGSAGVLSLIDQQPVNSGGQQVQGLDFAASLSERLGAGRLSAGLSWTHLLRAWQKPTDTAERDSSLGELGNPVNKWTLNLGYEQGAWGLGGRASYLGASELDDQFQKSLPEFPRWAFRVPAKVYVDLQARYRWGRAELYLGLDNAFATQAPPIIAGLPGSVDGSETAAGSYDPIGRRYYLGLRLSL